LNKKPSRNDACHCGSGKKFKVCHGQSNNKPYQLWAISGVVVLAILWFFFYESEPAIVPNRISSPLELAPPGKVWSVEHGHWHDAPSLPVSSASSAIPKKPPNAAPPGKIWSAEHGHWHDL
jgi:hypothetical protein